MTHTNIRKLISIDEDRCDGCGLCVPACAEGAIQVVNGKARLIDDRLCDGLGACLGECPQGALLLEEREGTQFDEEAVRQHQEAQALAATSLPCGCPSTTMTEFEPRDYREAGVERAGAITSQLRHWPVQLTLVPPAAPFLKNADLLLAADCAPFVYADFHRDFVRGRAVLVACPKLDSYATHLERLTEILKSAAVKSITVTRVEVGCCRGLTNMAAEAIRNSGADLPLYEAVLGVKGDVKTDPFKYEEVSHG